MSNNVNSSDRLKRRCVSWEEWKAKLLAEFDAACALTRKISRRADAPSD